MEWLVYSVGRLIDGLMDLLTVAIGRVGCFVVVVFVRLSV